MTFAKRPLIKCRIVFSPNQSFIRQLAIFRHLGYKADVVSLSKSSHYRNFCADTGNIPCTQKGDENLDDELRVRIKKIDLEHQKDIAHKRYRCRKCRNDLFYDTHILRHTIGTVDEDGVDHSEELQTLELCSYDYLITPMKWMNLEEFQGKVSFISQEIVSVRCFCRYRVPNAMRNLDNIFGAEGYVWGMKENHVVLKVIFLK